MQEADEETELADQSEDKTSKDKKKAAARPISQLTAGEKEKKTEEEGEDEIELLDKEATAEEEKEDETDERQSAIGPTTMDTVTAAQPSVSGPPSDELLRQLRAELDRELQSASPSDLRAAQMWQHLVSITAPLSHQLCETLRMVLEPTLASRLRGDYKTGKRLNLKKIIPLHRITLPT